MKEINNAQAKKLISQGIITDGMIVKVHAALDAAVALNRSVDITSWQNTEH